MITCHVVPHFCILSVTSYVVCDGDWQGTVLVAGWWSAIYCCFQWTDSLAQTTVSLTSSCQNESRISAHVDTGTVCGQRSTQRFNVPALKEWLYMMTQNPRIHLFVFCFVFVFGFFSPMEITNNFFLNLFLMYITPSYSKSFVMSSWPVLSPGVSNQMLTLFLITCISSSWNSEKSAHSLNHSEEVKAKSIKPNT